MSMVQAVKRAPLRRRLFLAAPLALAAGLAQAQQGGNDFHFKRSSLVVVSGGRDIKFEVELALDDTQRARGLMFREKLGRTRACCSISTRKRPSASG